MNNVGNTCDVKMKILLASKKLFAFRGFESTTVRQICEETGVNVMMVSYHFGGKDNVLSAIFQTFLPIERIPFLEHEVEDPVQGLCLIIREIILLSEDDPELISIMQQEMLLPSPRNQSLQKLTVPIWIKVRDLLELGQLMGIFEFESLDLTLIFVINTMLMFKYTEYLKPLILDPLPGKEDLIKEISIFIFRSLKFKEVDQIIFL